MFIPRIFIFRGYKTVDIQISTKDKFVKTFLKPRTDKQFNCHVCNSEMSLCVGTKQRKVRDLDIRGFKSTLHFSRRIGYCHSCQKNRVEAVEFISDFSPHYTKDYAWWVGTMCEFAPTKRAAKFCGMDNMTLRRIDYKRMQYMLQYYKIPEATAISVDEVYARKKSQHKNENRNKKFFTVVTDLDTRKVIWVTESRDKKALDEFFKIIGKEACSQIRVVACDQHDPYRASVTEYCKNASVVWDRFHIMQAFNNAANEVRKTLHDRLSPDDPIFKLTRGKYKYIFLKKPDRRNKREQSHIDQVYLENSEFSKIEIIKEYVYHFFDQPTEFSALDIFYELGRWIKQAGFEPLMNWWNYLEKNWRTVKNYFTYRVTSSLSEGINNVIKSLKRRSFGFRNMDYFKLKIMQVCGYLNSESMTIPV